MKKKPIQSRFVTITPKALKALIDHINTKYPTQKACAKALGIHRNALFKILTGRSQSVNERTANKIREVCKIKI